LQRRGLRQKKTQKLGGPIWKKKERGGGGGGGGEEGGKKKNAKKKNGGGGKFFLPQLKFHAKKERGGGDIAKLPFGKKFLFSIPKGLGAGNPHHPPGRGGKKGDSRPFSREPGKNLIWELGMLMLLFFAPCIFNCRLFQTGEQKALTNPTKSV